MSETSALEQPQHPQDGETRRDFLYLVTGAAGAVGTAIAVWPLIDSMNPAADVLALATVEVDLEPVQVGQRITVTWRGSPVFIDHRTPEQIAQAKADDLVDLKDLALDGDRVIRDELLIVVSICTHLDCIPKGQPGKAKGRGTRPSGRTIRPLRSANQWGPSVSWPPRSATI